jgi:Zn-dependent protease with chaperone function
MVSMSADSDAQAPSSVREGQAVFFDGLSNRKHAVMLRLAEQLELIEAGERVANWPYADIRRAEGVSEFLRLRLEPVNSLARLEIRDAALAAAVAARSVNLDASSGKGHVKRVVFWSLAAAVSIVLVAVFLIPLVADRLAPLVPASVERRLGEAVDQQVRVIFGKKTCTNPEGVAAFRKLVEKLRVAGDIRTPLDAQVLDSKISNAIALPGGKIYLFSGMLNDARHADEIAGVLAHELGHVMNRDGMRRLIQTSGTAFLIGLLFGDVSGSGVVLLAGRTLLDASYSRENEHDADSFSINVMNKLGRSPTAMGEFLVRITAKKEFGPSIFSSHPLSAERLERMRKVTRGPMGAELLTAAEWQALKGVCSAR